jgi:hypothetical protein
MRTEKQFYYQKLLSIAGNAVMTWAWKTIWQRTWIVTQLALATATGLARNVPLAHCGISRASRVLNQGEHISYSRAGRKLMQAGRGTGSIRGSIKGYERKASEGSRYGLGFTTLLG